MQAAEVLHRYIINNRVRWSAEHIHKNFAGIRTGYRIHGIKYKSKAAGKQFANRIKIENGIHHSGIDFNRINNFDFHIAQFLRTDFA